MRCCWVWVKEWVDWGLEGGVIVIGVGVGVDDVVVVVIFGIVVLGLLLFLGGLELFIVLVFE